MDCVGWSSRMRNDPRREHNAVKVLPAFSYGNALPWIPKRWQCIYYSQHQSHCQKIIFDMSGTAGSAGVVGARGSDIIDRGPTFYTSPDSWQAPNGLRGPSKCLSRSSSSAHLIVARSFDSLTSPHLIASKPAHRDCTFIHVPLGSTNSCSRYGAFSQKVGLVARQGLPRLLCDTRAHHALYVYFPLLP